MQMNDTSQFISTIINGIKKSMRKNNKIKYEQSIEKLLFKLIILQGGFFFTI